MVRKPARLRVWDDDGRHELIDSGTPARTDSWQSGFFSLPAWQPMRAMMFIIIKRYRCFCHGRDSTQLGKDTVFSYSVLRGRRWRDVDCLVGKEKSGLAVFHRPTDRLPSCISLPRYTKWRIETRNGPKVRCWSSKRW